MSFSDNTKEYLDLWTQQFQELDEFSWAVLHTVPDWQTVNVAMKQVAKKTSFDLVQNSSKVLQQYSYVKTYCTVEKLIEWNEKKLAPDERWAELFKHMNAQNVPFNEFSSIIEYILCLPGSTAPVERIFAMVKKVWATESSSLNVETLRAILYVKYNMTFECLEFYEFLKTQPELLRKIAGQDKYNFKQPASPRSVASTSMMSIDGEDAV
jgi:hypothetical protein